jgi:hypothetical protein
VAVVLLTGAAAPGLFFDEQHVIASIELGNTAAATSALSAGWRT